MTESKAKGDVFLRVLEHVAIKWGKDSLATLEISPSNYKEEQWYPFTELCDLLIKIKSNLGDNNPLTIY